MISLQDIQAAQTRIRNHIRHTPLIEAKLVKQRVSRAETLYLKLECLQICGSFKARGAGVQCFTAVDNSDFSPTGLTAR